MVHYREWAAVDPAICSTSIPVPSPESPRRRERLIEDLETAQQSMSDLPRHVELWAALRTKARWEKQIAGGLVAANVPVFLPLMTKVTLYRGKRQTRILPVFSGYVSCSVADFVGNPRVPRVIRQRVGVNSPAVRSRPTRNGTHGNCRLLDRSAPFKNASSADRAISFASSAALLGTEGIIRRLKTGETSNRHRNFLHWVEGEVAADEWLVGRT